MPDASNTGDALTREQFAVAEIMLASLLSECATNDLALFQEGYLKGIVAKACLNAGFELREGSHETDRDWLVKRDGAAGLATRKVDREPRAEGSGSRDLRVETPRFHVELKCFGEFGAKDHLDRGATGFRGDLERVRDGHADAFLCAVAGKLYDDARGEKSDARGRKPLDGNTFSFLPARLALPEGRCDRFEVRAGTDDFVVHAGRIRCPGGAYGTAGTGDRVVLLVVRSAAPDTGGATS